MDGPFSPVWEKSGPMPCELFMKTLPVSMTSNSEFRSYSPAFNDNLPEASSCSIQPS